MDPKLEPVIEETDKPPQPGIALCLSGGGYRAMLFHAGSLWRLHETGILARLNRVSSVSGGSITSAVLGLAWNQLSQPGARFADLVVTPVRTLASHTIDAFAVLEGVLLPGTISDRIAGEYDNMLFHGRTLQDLPDQLDFIINATNIQSGVLMRFSKRYMRDYRVGEIRSPRLPLAKAVAASSAFPPVLSPCEIDLAKYGLHFEPSTGGEDLAFPPYTTNLVLSDGGVYDNLGLEPAWKKFDTILVSDGGGHFQPEPAPHHDWARHTYRVLNLIDSQVRALRTRQIIALYQAKERKGAYWGIRQDIRTYSDTPALPCPADRTLALASTPTRLQQMDNTLQERLINWGYAVTDAAIRRYFDTTLAAPAAFPYPASGI